MAKKKVKIIKIITKNVTKVSQDNSQDNSLEDLEILQKVIDEALSSGKIKVPTVHTHFTAGIKDGWSTSSDPSQVQRFKQALLAKTVIILYAQSCTVDTLKALGAFEVNFKTLNIYGRVTLVNILDHLTSELPKSTLPHVLMPKIKKTGLLSDLNPDESVFLKGVTNGQIAERYKDIITEFCDALADSSTSSISTSSTTSTSDSSVPARTEDHEKSYDSREGKRREREEQEKREAEASSATTSTSSTEQQQIDLATRISAEDTDVPITKSLENQGTSILGDDTTE